MFGGVPDKSGNERRASVRYTCDPESFSPENSCRPITAPSREAWSAIVRDLSTSGIGIIVNRRFEPGTLLKVDLEDAEHTTSTTLLVRVARISQEDPTSWLLGCTFTTKMTESDLLSLM
jgi:hypothetical protein